MTWLFKLKEAWENKYKDVDHKPLLESEVVQSGAKSFTALLRGVINKLFIWSFVSVSSS